MSGDFVPYVTLDEIRLSYKTAASIPVSQEVGTGSNGLRCGRFHGCSIRSNARSTAPAAQSSNTFTHWQQRALEVRSRWRYALDVLRHGIPETEEDTW